MQSNVFRKNTANSLRCANRHDVSSTAALYRAVPSRLACGILVATIGTASFPPGTCNAAPLHAGRSAQASSSPLVPSAPEPLVGGDAALLFRSAQGPRRTVDEDAGATSEVTPRIRQWDTQLHERKKAENRRYALPVNDYVLTAHFGQPGPHWAKRHTGQDFAVPTGTPVHAVADGVVVYSGWDNAYGRYMRIRHKDGVESWYGHLSEFEVRSGHVKAGKVIAYSGSTGNVTGPHLHLEIRKPDGDNGTPIDPVDWLHDHSVSP
jgi:murein DD-endopeptidase MepM/ murein hydrolase activator NlpD